MENSTFPDLDEWVEPVEIEGTVYNVRGAFNGYSVVLRAAYRYWYLPAIRFNNIGFRCIPLESA